MAIPAVEGEEALLPQGRHRTDLDEIEAYFVAAAPFSEERAIVFAAFRTWFTLIGQLIPSARFWIDGGFVTHKPWAAPSDVDVMILCQAEVVDSLTTTEQDRLDQLLTIPASPGRPRFQPMGGLVDAFIAYRSSPDDAPYWNAQWSRVKGADGSEVLALSKGFLEVVT